MRPDTTRWTLETMSHPLGPAFGTSLAGVSRIHEHHFYADGPGFVVLKLSERPGVKTGSHALSSFDSVADMGEIFQDDSVGPDLQGFLNDDFRRFVICLGDPPSLFAGDFSELLPGALTAFGQEPAAVGMVTIASVFEPAAAYDHARAGGREVVFSHVNSHCDSGPDKGRIGGFNYKIQILFAFAKNEFSFLGESGLHKVFLMLPANQSGLYAPLFQDGESDKVSV
jgi:hypothetical protein